MNYVHRISEKRRRASCERAIIIRDGAAQWNRTLHVRRLMPSATPSRPTSFAMFTVAAHDKYDATQHFANVDDIP